MVYTKPLCARYGSEHIRRDGTSATAAIILTNRRPTPKSCPLSITSPIPRAAARPVLWRPSIAPCSSAVAYCSLPQSGGVLLRKFNSFSKRLSMHTARCDACRAVALGGRVPGPASGDGSRRPDWGHWPCAAGSYPHPARPDGAGGGGLRRAPDVRHCFSLVAG